MSEDKKVGKITLITGPMCSDKSTELLRLLYRKAQVDDTKVAFIGHVADDRSGNAFSTHNPLYRNEIIGHSVTFCSTSKISNIFEKLTTFDVIGIDEAQWFPDLYSCSLLLAETHGIDIIISGLSSNFQRKGYPRIQEMYPVCANIIHLTALCKRCPLVYKKKESIAPFTYKYPTKSTEYALDNSIDGDFSIQPGSAEKYMPVCEQCYVELTTMTDKYK